MNVNTMVLGKYALAAVFLRALVSAVEYEKFEACGGNVLHFYTNLCHQEPCIVHRGQTITATMNCLSNVDADKLRLDISGNIAGIELFLPGHNKNGCDGKNVTCPIRKGQEIFVVGSLDILKIFPKVDVISKFHLKKVEKGKKYVTICCAKIPVTIRD